MFVIEEEIIVKMDYSGNIPLLDASWVLLSFGHSDFLFPF